MAQRVSAQAGVFGDLIEKACDDLLNSADTRAFAGARQKHGEPVESCTILTTEANELMQPIHERMPVIIPPDQYGLWLDPRCQDTGMLAKLLRPFPSEGMLAYRVSTLVNNAKNDVPQCVEAMR